MDITNLIELETICLDLKAQTKDEALKELVEMLEAAGKLNSQSQFLADIWKREEIGNTGFDDGIAIPHAKSDAVAKPAVAVGISRSGIDYGAEDGELSDVFSCWRLQMVMIIITLKYWHKFPPKLSKTALLKSSNRLNREKKRLRC